MRELHIPTTYPRNTQDFVSSVCSAIAFIEPYQLFGYLKSSYQQPYDLIAWSIP